jgi:hypothetical protein
MGREYLGRTFVVTAGELNEAWEPLLRDLQYSTMTGELIEQVRSLLIRH